MLTQGFEKTAAIGLGKAYGAAKGGVVRAARAVGGAVKGFVRGEQQSGIKAYRKAVTGKNRAPGELLASRREVGKALESGKKATPAELKQMKNKASADVMARKSRMEESKKAGKPSWASKHPFLTAGGLYLGARYAFGGGDNGQQQSQQPQYLPPQY